MPTLALTDFNIVVSVLGGWVSLFGLVSYLCKESFYLSEALISLLAGVAVSPVAANLIRPLEYAGSQANLDAITLSFSRLVLGVQLALAGVQLPSKYLQREWRALAWLLGPLMTCMWMTASLLVWALVVVPSSSSSPSHYQHLPFLHALVIGSCVTPTDPVLSNVIVKGRFADQHVPVDLQQIIIAESGANDGLGYPFLFLALYLIQYTTSIADAAVVGGHGGSGDGGSNGGAAKAMGLWFGETLGYTILLSVAYGAAVGYVAQKLLHWAQARRFVDRESFAVFAISLALFVTGTCGILGSDDLLACFIAGNVFTWDDWFRLETKDDSLQPAVDMLLNVAVFMWYGAVCPWSLFVAGPVPLGQLVALAVLMLLLRRLPWVLLLLQQQLAHPHSHCRIIVTVPQIKHRRQAVFVGFFGPVGVSAVFYLYITLDFLEALSSSGSGGGMRPDVALLGETVTVVVWFLAVSSIVVHGLSIPLGKLSTALPRTVHQILPSSSATSTPSPQPPPGGNHGHGLGLSGAYELGPVTGQAFRRGHATPAAALPPVHISSDASSLTSKPPLGSGAMLSSSFSVAGGGDGGGGNGGNGGGGGDESKDDDGMVAVVVDGGGGGRVDGDNLRPPAGGQSSSGRLRTIYGVGGTIVSSRDGGSSTSVVTGLPEPLMPASPPPTKEPPSGKTEAGAPALVQEEQAHVQAQAPPPGAGTEARAGTASPAAAPAPSSPQPNRSMRFSLDSART
ncbi:cation/H+ exchanger [Niveomyces insectorum RCEF 264]|uniref:Cation/H+ exchanger n=1 Tax=Niveomyces insectorum RCEF 264 TaxID=1081102 RepID=A0A167ZRW1_9HYPO|nr:cation/H+ exchanger [Niveomyces insectorum RCEF 264]